MNQFSRRDFMKAVGLAGAGSLIGAASVPAQGAAKPVGLSKMPLRAFGKTGVKVSILSLGGIFDIMSNQLILQKALDWGVKYWDTADCYTGGKSEEGIGAYFEKNPDVRKRIFLVSKSDRRDPAGLTELLTRSLERLKTDHLDLYFLHGVGNPKELNADVKAWAEKAKKDGKIKFFGFSTHANMDKCLMEASKLGWIDGIMTTYNYRLVHDDAMKAGVEACAKAGIGLTAMKTQAKKAAGEDPAGAKLIEHFTAQGYTAEQAKLKVIWDNPQFSAVCSAMYTVSVLSSNVAAATDQVKLSALDHEALLEEARVTCDGYCAGCSHLCEAAIGGQVSIGDAMRGLMYLRNYGNRDQAREVFAGMSEVQRQGLAALDYAAAERVCPHRLPIGAMMREASELLA